jgi:CRISPR type III-A/MTUBE-associated protein Csm6
LSNKKYVLFSPIGNHDPFGYEEIDGTNEYKITEGPMLHIIRQYKPEAILLFLTKAMKEKEDFDQRYSNSIKQFTKEWTPEIRILEEGLNIDRPYLFDDLPALYNNILGKIHEKYPDHEILYNITSGTPQMINAIILEAQTSSVSAIPVQVTTPKKKSNFDSKEFRSYQSDDWKYVISETENRTIEPKFNIFKSIRLKTQLKTLIKRYEYLAAINLIEYEDKNLFITNREQESNKEKILKLLKHCRYRLNLEFEKAQKSYTLPIENKIFEYFYTIKIKQEKQEFADFALKIPPILSELLQDFVDKEIPLAEIIEIDKREGKEIPNITRKKIQEYDNKYYTTLLQFLDEKFKGKKGDKRFENTFINTTTLLAIADYFSIEKYHDNSKEAQNYNRVKNLFGKFTKFEQNIRNSLAHEITDINEEKIKEKSDYTSNKILQNLENILIIEKDFPKGQFIYDELNQKIMDLL